MQRPLDPSLLIIDELSFQLNLVNTTYTFLYIAAYENVRLSIL
jgi:hypothetical protein